MPSDAVQLAAIKSQALARIKEITAQPKPNYNIDGQSISWGDYLGQLQTTVAWCDDQLSAEEPIEVQSQGYT